MSFCASTGKEYFNAGPYESRLDASKKAPNDLGLKHGDYYFVGESVPFTLDGIIDADDITDLVACRAQDECGDVADEYPDMSKEEEAAFTKELNALIVKHFPEPKFFRVIDVKEHIYLPPYVAPKPKTKVRKQDVRGV